MSMARYSAMAVTAQRGPAPAGRLGIQRAEAAVAVGLERAHAEFFGQGEGLVVVGFGLRDVRGSRCAAISPRSRRAYAWLPRSLWLTGERQRPLGEGTCFLQVASQQIALPLRSGDRAPEWRLISSD